MVLPAFGLSPGPEIRHACACCNAHRSYAIKLENATGTCGQDGVPRRPALLPGKVGILAARAARRRGSGIVNISLMARRRTGRA